MDDYKMSFEFIVKENKRSFTIKFKVEEKSGNIISNGKKITALFPQLNTRHPICAPIGTDITALF